MNLIEKKLRSLSIGSKIVIGTTNVGKVFGVLTEMDDECIAINNKYFVKISAISELSLQGYVPQDRTDKSERVITPDKTEKQSEIITPDKLEKQSRIITPDKIEKSDKIITPDKIEKPKSAKTAQNPENFATPYIPPRPIEKHSYDEPFEPSADFKTDENTESTDEPETAPKIKSDFATLFPKTAKTPDRIITPDTLEKKDSYAPARNILPSKMYLSFFKKNIEFPDFEITDLTALYKNTLSNEEKKLVQQNFDKFIIRKKQNNDDGLLGLVDDMYQQAEDADCDNISGIWRLLVSCLATCTDDIKYTDISQGNLFDWLAVLYTKDEKLKSPRQAAHFAALALNDTNTQIDRDTLLSILVQSCYECGNFSEVILLCTKKPELYDDREFAELISYLYIIYAVPGKLSEDNYETSLQKLRDATGDKRTAEKTEQKLPTSEVKATIVAVNFDEKKGKIKLIDGSLLPFEYEKISDSGLKKEVSSITDFNLERTGKTITVNAILAGGKVQNIFRTYQKAYANDAEKFNDLYFKQKYNEVITVVEEAIAKGDDIAPYLPTYLNSYMALANKTGDMKYRTAAYEIYKKHKSKIGENDIACRNAIHSLLCSIGKFIEAANIIDELLAIETIEVKQILNGYIWQASDYEKYAQQLVANGGDTQKIIDAYTNSITALKTWTDVYESDERVTDEKKEGLKQVYTTYVTPRIEKLEKILSKYI